MTVFDHVLHHAEQRVINSASDWPGEMAKHPLVTQIASAVFHVLAIGAAGLAIYVTALQIAP